MREKMEKLIVLPFPREDIREIESIVRAVDCFVALVNGDLYDVGTHLAAEDFKFTATLDRNIYTRIAGLASGSPIPVEQLRDYRCAAAILAFAQITDITFDYFSSLYEYASTQGGSEAINDLNRFRAADSFDTREVIEFALGRTDSPPRTVLKSVAPTPPAESEFERVTYQFRVNYTLALKVAILAKEPIPPVERMLQFLDWLHAEFVWGAPAAIFANRYFSPSRFGRMLKGFTRRGIKNAAWDMALVQVWRKHALAGLKNGKPALLISRDRAVRDMAQKISAETNEELAGFIREPWGKNSTEGKRVLAHYLRLNAPYEAGNKDGRKLPEHPEQVKIMAQLEEQLFGKGAT